MTPRDEEDRLHSQLRGGQYEFVIENNGVSQEVSLSIENIGWHTKDTVKIELRVRNYGCPTSIKEWKEDLIYLYITTYLRGKDSAKELATPLLSNIEIGGFSNQDIRISMFVYTTFPSGIWDAVGRIANLISLYHSDHFQYLKQIYQEKGDQYQETSEVIDLQDGAELAQHSENQTYIQAFGYLTDYFEYKLNDGTADKNL